MRRIILAWMLFGLVGCGEASDGTDSRLDQLEFHTEIRPILDEHCNGCHAQDTVAPHAFVDYETVSRLAPLMLDEMRSGSMPPWALSDTCGEFSDNPTLDLEVIQTFADWIDSGMAKGPGETPKYVPPAEEAFEAGFVLDTGEYTPEVGGNDDYRCFAFDADVDAETFVTGIRVKSAAPEIVHHVIVYSVLNPEEVARIDALDAADEGPGYSCFGGPGAKRFQVMSGWAPGDPIVRMPEDTGIRIRPGQRLVAQFHYSGDATDRTELEFSTSDDVEQAYLVLIGDTSLLVPAGQTETKSVFEFSVADLLPLPVPVQVHAILPHMHLLGRKLRMSKMGAANEECLLDAPRYDFSWQRFYQYQSPLRLEPNDKIRLECEFDTTGRVDPVRWGENTDDEMCLVAVYATLAK